jgi:hypothetical protein
MIKPDKPEDLINANNPEEYEQALKMISEGKAV